jgi:hypothetical protein
MVESVYCAVWTDSLYKADYVSSLKGYCVNQPNVLVIFKVIAQSFL